MEGWWDKGMEGWIGVTEFLHVQQGRITIPVCAFFRAFGIQDAVLIVVVISSVFVVVQIEAAVYVFGTKCFAIRLRHSRFHILSKKCFTAMPIFSN